MINSHLPFMSEYAGRFDRRSNRSDVGQAPFVRRLLTALLTRPRRPSLPPYLNDHLCRDIGIEPTPKRQEWFWPW
jgi:hypothetical protein